MKGTIMKIKLDRVTAVEVEVELPETCPGCGLDFHDEDSLKEDQFIGSEQSGRLVDGSPECCEGYENGTQPVYVVGYRCAECGEVLVTTEDEMGEPMNDATSIATTDRPHLCPHCGVRGFGSACCPECGTRGVPSDCVDGMDFQAVKDIEPRPVDSRA
jgi:DNA-directed RNA polymerase subunit RPC12/RpoP